ncbi:RNA polymerase sigma factor [Paracoccus beibuensis]|uniref:RNA polymerase sigma factor n=1 Tax=Paracoccus beibuensis TaxID=547602 RepID=UPI00223FA7BB|nr:RNA polymerase sigma factor [Paracoccus beibuensis]
MEDAFEADLVAALPQLRRYALSPCRQGAMADDLVQGTVERAVASRGRVDPDMRLEAWLFRVLRNLWIDQTRRTRTRGVELDVTEMPEAAIHDGERALESVLMLRKTEVAIATLPADRQDVLRLVCIEGMSYSETSEIVDIPIGTVMSRLARSRVALPQKAGIN